MPKKLTLGGPQPTPLSRDIEIGPVPLDYDLTEFNYHGLVKYRRQSLRPIRLWLTQKLGLDRTLFELKDKPAFSITITHFVEDVDENGVVVERHLLDVRLFDLVADDFVCDSNLALQLLTRTAPEFVFPQP